MEGLTAKQLQALHAKAPWNQWAALALANLDVEKGKLEAAAARLRAFGKPAAMVRDVRHLLGQLESALGHLEEADELLTGILGARLVRFQKVASEMEDVAKKAQEALFDRLRTNDIPYAMQVELNAATDEQGREIVRKWVTEQLAADPALAEKRAAYLALGDVVPVALAAGGVKLRRAQALSGGERDAMLGEAERLFLAIRTEAEGQPEFRIGLGEIYARLGKTTESEEQFAAVLGMHDPELNLQVARVYRGIGSTARAKEVATNVFESAASPAKDNAAVLLGIMANGQGDEAEAEKWFRKADQKDPMVKISLLEIEARRMLVAGKYTECSAKYAQIAKQHLANASDLDMASINNAALAHQARFQCSADPQALVDAETTLEKAYRVKADEPIVVANLSELHDDNGRRRVLGKRIDLRGLRATSSEIASILSILLDGPEREAVLADLDADYGLRRANELVKQYEVLAPNSIGAYVKSLAYALERRDEAGLAALLGRVQRAKSIDSSAAEQDRARFQKGELDAEWEEHLKNSLPDLEATAGSRKASPKTRAAALFMAGTLRTRASMFSGNTAAVTKGRQQLQQAAKLWPALSAYDDITEALIDEAALAADARAWIEERRVYGACAALARLAAKHAPLAAEVQASKQWSEVRAVRQAALQAGARPTIDALRVARLLGDPALEAHAKPVLDDKLTRLTIEIGLVLDPTSPKLAESLAFLDKH